MPIVVDGIDEPEVWTLLKWMAARLSDWVLIGGLMVATFDIEYGHPSRQTQDVDSLFDVRHADRGAIRRHVEELQQDGFEFVEAWEGLGHRMKRGDLNLDILSTDHFPTDPLVSLLPRRETFQTPGGSHAVKRREAVQVSFRGDRFMLPRPNLLGAIVVKAAASLKANRPKDHRDFAHLVASVDDPIAIGADLKAHERRMLAGRLEQRLVRAELASIGNDAETRLRLLVSPLPAR